MAGGLHPSPAVIASWPKPNYVDPVREGLSPIIIGIVLTVLATLLVSARLYSRFAVTKAPGLDDFLIVVALAFSIAQTTTVILIYKDTGFGRHIWDVPVAWYQPIRKSSWINEILYIPATSGVKISVMLFYRRLSTTFTHAFMIATWIGIAFNVLYFTGWIIYVGAQCSPYYAYWRQFDPVWVRSHNYKCGNEHYSLPVSAALSVMGDAYATVLPLVLVRGLDLPKRQKAALYALFGLGFIVVAAGIVRTVFLNYLMNESYDTTWYLWKVQVWTFVELYVAIMAASAPALKPLFRRFLVQPILTSHRNRKESWHANNGFASWRRSGNVQSDRALKRVWSNGFKVQDEAWFENDIENNSSDGPRKDTLQALPDGKVYQLQVDADEVGPYVAGIRPQKS